LGGLVEDVVTLAGLVADVAERQKQVLAGLNGLVVDTSLSGNRQGEGLDLFRRDLRRSTGGLEYRCGLIRYLLRVLEFLERESSPSS
jgi:hypothetical protein